MVAATDRCCITGQSRPTCGGLSPAIERGNHPFDDVEASAAMLSDAAIAQAQIGAMVGRSK